METPTATFHHRKRGGFLFLAFMAVAAVLTGCQQPMATTMMEWRVRHFVPPREQAAEFPYLVQLPRGYEDDTNRVWPLVFYLHGIGEWGTDHKKILRFGPPHLIAEGRDLPCIVISPQMPEGYFTFRESNAMIQILDEVMARYRVDKHRVHLTGNSMGAYGAVVMAAREPERFASLVTMAGGVDYLDSLRLRDMPLWAFHGAKDPIIPVEESRRMVDLVNRIGGKARLTVYPDLEHDCWSRAYDDPALWEWMLAQKK